MRRTRGWAGRTGGGREDDGGTGRAGGRSPSRCRPRRRRPRVAAAVSAATAATALVISQPAQACSIPWPGPSEEELLVRADLVFEGIALSGEDPNAGAPVISSGDPIFWTFRVNREIKGSASQPQVVVSARSGATCGVHFRIDAHYRVFASLVDGVYRTGLGSGTQELRRGETSTTTTTAAPHRLDPPVPMTVRPRPLARTG
jgi:hypothetical protein